MLNLQTPEKRSVSDGETLRVHSIFNTIQGEGPYVGTPACFIRLAGCNLQCPQCDTEYTKGVETLSANHVAQFVGRTFAHELVVITGGEPFRQNIYPMICGLWDLGKRVQIETNGTLDVQGEKQWLYRACCSGDLTIVCSPKTGKISSDVFGLLMPNGVYKYVAIADDISATDGLPVIALGHPCHPQLARPPQGWEPSRVFLAPANYVSEGDSLKDVAGRLAYLKNQDACVKSCQRFGYRLSLQTHKYIGVE